ncbi:16S rRNA methyltransferase (macronuclear) [Tetrahymena thermophila SB210]|uniref:16S rRNA methyltransferase n=1 Tax=Tetrahymena thermophila (strain SB210) TaxID=312017 RepID=Q22Z09_TETTS|nr:16S rRNA methyltransferase [Tetrahymena thermophila SB210]EAR90512.2 16S rRNA methyltransferase [Tetrahymena thermophila SB210]|eukprot:XP_001010757.2 16S rRNA methyltransferase [Tetrahymena thermophila SB210]
MINLFHSTNLKYRLLQQSSKLLNQQIQYSLFNFIKQEGLENKLSSLSKKVQQEKKGQKLSKVEQMIQQQQSQKKQNSSLDEEAIQHNDDILFDTATNKVHYPVLIDKITQVLQEEFYPHSSSHSEKCLVDCTLGSAGHAKHFLQKFPYLYILGLDLDPRMLQYINDNVKSQLSHSDQNRFKTRNENFTNIDKINLYKIFEEEFPSYKNFHAIFADLGYNTLHLENSEWGFSYLRNGKLDMRYNQSSQTNSAADILNKASYLELFEIIRQYGEDPNADVISQMIIKQRQIKPFETTKDVVDLILEDQSGYSFKGGQYKAITKLFQALRIATNQELTNLQVFMDKIYDKLLKDGLGIIITFHSLEENIVEQKLRDLKRQKNIEILQMGEKPDINELQKNSKSRSAKLYTFKKLKK